MNEYRKTIPLSTETKYWFVKLGSIPGTPDWHKQLYANRSYPFPTEAAAQRFAAAEAGRWPGMSVEVIEPEGSS